MRARHLFAGFVLTSALACTRSAPTALDMVALTNEVSVTRLSGSIRVANGTSRPVGYVVWNRGWLALFGACTEPTPSCTHLPSGAAETVPDAEMGGFEPNATEAVVYWWHVVPDGAGGHRAEVHDVVVPLR